MSFEDSTLKLWDELLEIGDVIWKENEPSFHQCGPITVSTQE